MTLNNYRGEEVVSALLLLKNSFSLYSSCLRVFCLFLRGEAHSRKKLVVAVLVAV